MNLNDFTLVLINKEVAYECRHGYMDIMGFDAIHKLIEDRTQGPIAMHGITVMNDARKCRVPFICMTSHADAAHYVPMIKAIGEWLDLERLVESYETWRNRVTFMIDDGSTETLAIFRLCIRYVICAFHFLKVVQLRRSIRSYTRG